MSFKKIGRAKPSRRVIPERDRSREKFRGSRQSRGYDGDWDRMRLQYKAEVTKGFCEECRRRGWQKVCDVIDHMIPVEDDPDRRLDWGNLDGLCHFHHNGFKRRIEVYARKIGAIAMLPQWIKFPETRPAQFQIVKFGPLKELFDAEDRSR